MRDPLRVFIGYDAREPDGYRVTEASLRRHASAPLAITPLVDERLRRAGLYYRAPQPGTRVDCFDGRPFSTQFSFSRFAVHLLAQFEGWALFCDSDFLFRADVAELFALADDRFALMCVDRTYRPAAATKMDGVPQEHYPRKGASALMLWNCAHPAHLALTRDAVNQQPGSWLHGFRWLGEWDVGPLPEAWNWLPGASDPAIDPKAVHFTEGLPSMHGYAGQAFADEWRVYAAVEVAA